MTFLANPYRAGTAAPQPPLGVLSCLIALLLCFGAAVAFERYTFDLATTVVRPTATIEDQRKLGQLTLQQAALADPGAMLFFGRSELWTADRAQTPSGFFQDKPTGFWVFDLGRPGTDSIFFLQTVAALGNDLRGRKVAISLSPTSYYQTDQIRSERYTGNFSPRIAEKVAFDTPISARERQYLARRMLDYPATLRGRGILRLGLSELAEDSLTHWLSYAVVYPLGRVQVWASELNDTRLILQFARQHPPSGSAAKIQPRPLGWKQIVISVTDQMARAAGADPFGAEPSQYEPGAPGRDHLLQARARYYQGLNNGDGHLSSGSRGYLPDIQSSVERTDLQHEIAVLRELGAIPLVINRPEDGVVSDFSDSGTSPRATRQQYYDLFVADMRQTGVSFVSFASHDEDPFFLLAASDHYSRRGWVYVDRALDLFWRGGSNAQLADSIRELDEWSPSPPLPSPPVTATVTQRPGKEAVQRRHGAIPG